MAHSGTQSCKVSTTSGNPLYAMWTGGGMLVNAAAQQWYRLYLYQAAWPAAPSARSFVPRRNLASMRRTPANRSSP